MPTKQIRILTALCGILGTVALSLYFSTVLVPLPPENATAQQVTAFATHYHKAILLDCGLQAIGSILSVIFALALIHMAGTMHRFASRLTLLTSGIIMVLSLAEVTFSFGVIQASINGHPNAALACFDLTNVFVHVFLLAPSLFLMLGAALYGTRLLPPVFVYSALTLGVVFQILGYVGLFSTTAVAIVIYVLMAQNLWTVAAAVTLILDGEK